mgnify:CR=1 FL=1
MIKSPIWKDFPIQFMFSQILDIGKQANDKMVLFDSISEEVIKNAIKSIAKSQKEKNNRFDLENLVCQLII